MLSFDIRDTEDLVTWCSELASFLEEQNVKAAIFFPGKIAEENPECLAYFGEGIDIGSQTYNYVDLTSVSDFTVQLEEVRKGKEAVDNAGNLFSRVFRAPYGATDENIYYLLSQCGVIADFSYEQQYNLFQNGQFIKYNAITYEGSIDSVELILNKTRSTDLKIITFDSSRSVSQIVDVISRLKNGEVKFVSASDVAEVDLTGRGVSPGF
ncbi:MAG: polysaccharide deacetylase family protein [Candidatus Bathyarchaeum sp.]|nr:MAG: polysaccharide deacetylase family protein [Candidatus Bathyarchaeum sp.]